MEDSGILKWIAIIALIAYNGVRQIRKTAQKGAQSRNTVSGEAWPTSDTSPQKQPEKQLEIQQERVEHPLHEPKRAFRNTTQTDMGHDRTLQLPASDRPTNPARTAKRPANTPNPSENAETRAENSASDDFDLRQAVIMSEILRPKFDE